MSLKGRVSTLSFALMIIAFLLMYFVEGNAVGVMIAFILAGLAFGLFYPYMFAMGALVVAPDRSDRLLSILVLRNYIHRERTSYGSCA